MNLLHSMRYPSRRCGHSDGRRESIERNPVEFATVPSLPGFAFAVCAAVLPLLRARDISTAAVVVSLVQKCLPLLIEPSMCSRAASYHDQGNRDDLRIGTPAFQLSYENYLLVRSRFQHLFNRVEQVCAGSKHVVLVITTLPQLILSSVLVIVNLCELTLAFVLSWHTHYLSAIKYCGPPFVGTSLHCHQRALPRGLRARISDCATGSDVLVSGNLV